MKTTNSKNLRTSSPVVKIRKGMPSEIELPREICLSGVKNALTKSEAITTDNKSSSPAIT
jgi:hypothetical protein